MSEVPQLQTKLQIANYNLQLTTSKVPLQVLDYRSVKGNKQCLGRNKKRNQLFPTDCLHQMQPKNCKDTSWKKLYEIVGKGGLELCVSKGISIYKWMHI